MPGWHPLSPACEMQREAELRSHLITSPFSRSTHPTASPSLTLTTNDSQKVNHYPNLAQKKPHREVTWPGDAVAELRTEGRKTCLSVLPLTSITAPENNIIEICLQIIQLLLPVIPPRMFLSEKMLSLPCIL